MKADRTRFGDLVNAWYAAARSDDLPTRSAARPIARVVLDLRLVLWRGPGGRPVAAYDRCLHRNARLSSGDVVRVPEATGPAIGCPYHGWTYGADGKLAHVPSLPPGERPPALCLPTYPTREEGGLVWVWPGDRPPEEFPERRPFPMPCWDTPGWGAYYMTTHFDNDVTNLVENFMDVPHTVFVHRGWFRSPARREVPTRVERTKDAVLVTYQRPDDAIGLSDRLMNPRGLPLTHTDKFYVPNTTRVDYVWGAGGPHERAFIITSTCTPESEHRTRVYTLISYKLGGVMNAVARAWLPFYTRKVITQDVVIMANQGENLRHHGGRFEFQNTAADRIHELIEDLRAWARAGRPEPGPPPRIDDIVMWV